MKTIPPIFLCMEVVAIQRTKYNVDMDAAKRTYDGKVFASVMEMRFYRDVVLPQVESGQIKHYELQKPYELQPKFTHNGKSVRPIVYVADFYLEYSDGRIEVIDTKGAADAKSKMKRKMMWYMYPDLTYRWITYVKKYGGWVEYEVVQKLRKEAKKAKKEDQEEKNEQDK